MIHRAIRDMIVEDSGQEAWNVIESEAGIGPAEMISAIV
jgi:hypothetical protein